jgi:branched-chain amino acid transport system substrate-binding protein
VQPRLQAVNPISISWHFAKGRVREDGRMMHDMYLVEVKTPSESKAKWDYYKVLRRIPAEEAAQPLSESKCSLVRK